MEFVNKKLEEFNNFVKGKKIAIIGLGVSNIPLIDYFYEKGSNVTAFDNRTMESIDSSIIEKLNKYNFNYYFGEDNLKYLKGFDIIFRSPSAMPFIKEFEEEVARGAILTTEIEMVLKLTPSKTIGVTGTEGKTTTTSIIYEILKNAGKNCFLGGNIGKPIFTSVKDMKPDDIIVLEMSSFQLMNMEVSPEVALVTNMYPDHLNVHRSLEEYQDAKKNIFTHQNREGLVVLNYDNDVTNSFAKDVTSNVVFFSSKEKLDNGYIYDREDGYIKYCENGTFAKLVHKSEIMLRGIHNYENICAALAVTSRFVKVEDAIETIKNFKGVEHRLEFVREIDNVKYYNDSIGTSPASTIAGLNAFDENIVLIAGGSDKGLDYKEVGEAIAKNVGTLILCGPTSDKIEDATRDALNGKEINIIRVNNLEEAVILSKEKSKKRRHSFTFSCKCKF